MTSALTNSLSKEELRRYARHISLEEFGVKGQISLLDLKVLVIGVGGLGCPVLQYLTTAGVGCIGLVDADKVDVSNLQRQILFGERDVGHYKVDRAIERLRLYNSKANFISHRVFINKENALEIISKYDIIVDGSDNFPTRYLVNDACVISGKPLVFGSIFKFEGQVSVFNYKGGPTYRCLYPEPPSTGDIQDCNEIGVIGVVPALVACFMSNEVIKICAQIGEVLQGKLLSINLLTNNMTVFSFDKNPTESIVNFLGDYNYKSCSKGKISPKELEQKIRQGNVWILDVRQLYEYEVYHLESSHHIPLGVVEESIHRLPRDRDIVVVCHKGIRSLRVVKILLDKGFKNVKSLSGGMDSYHSIATS